MRDDIDYGFDASAIHPDRLRAEAKELEKRAANLRARAAETDAAMRRIEEEHDRRAAEGIPVDRSAIQLTDGSPVPEDGSHLDVAPEGQQKGYVVLSPEERARGFVRPVRDAYKHQKCGAVTTMGRSIAETYARDPGFYSGTFCIRCGGHFPVGEDGEFTWYENDGSDGPKVGT